jgi:hypothetical protein
MKHLNTNLTSFIYLDDQQWWSQFRDVVSPHRHDHHHLFVDLFLPTTFVKHIVDFLIQIKIRIENIIFEQNNGFSCNFNLN